ncbi:PREDICTED: uncharacterized protein LOC109383889 isoform X3 [Hipposideros armiger]|uniref:Uncharacterized protein LOC109383889 isoform X3 n=1 Tax=Hipposideros armiger TaxID=186990 RepID=A0A8B7RLT8_HIPAR|nr:PREDICTED: uncharacterized protein LOC109383889 isoform X3 [Hipposideros armiger]
MIRDGGAVACRDSPGARESSKEGAGLRAFAAKEGRFHRGSDQVSRPVCACACAMRTFLCTAFCSNMEFRSARQAILQLLRTVAPTDLPVLLEWMRTTRDFDEFTHDNDDAILKNIAEDLRNCLPLETMLSSEHLALQKIQQRPEPTIQVDAFLYDEDFIDSLCEEGKMSRNYCMVCGSHQTAPLGFVSHSFSLMELKFIYHHVLPDLSGKVLVDVGSRLGTVLYGVLHADICTQGSLLQNADIVIMNNVFEYFLDETEQARAWEYISHNVRKQGSLLVTVPSLEESFSGLQVNIQLSPWVEQIPLNYDIYPEKDIDREALEQIHLYKIL